jgi:hypothetical protein
MAGYIERIFGIIPHTNKSVDIQLDGIVSSLPGGMVRERLRFCVMRMRKRSY